LDDQVPPAALKFFFTLVVGPAISDLFSQVGTTANIKLLVLGAFSASNESLMSPVRSLNIEHVSPADLMAQEISRRTSLGQRAERLQQKGIKPSEEIIVALMRRWFWARKPDAGFILNEFPATLLQAKVLDEWLDARGESLDGVVALDSSSEQPVAQHYRTLGLLMGTQGTSAA
jgi:adenylate kinase